MRADDALKYVAAMFRHETDWALDSIGGSICGGHEDELDSIHQVIARATELADRLPDPDRYADGRMVMSRADIELGVYTECVWHPEVSEDKSRSWRGTLRHDPGTPCPGIYEVTTYPMTQEIHVRVVRAA